MATIHDRLHFVRTKRIWSAWNPVVRLFLYSFVVFLWIGGCERPKRVTIQVVDETSLQSLEAAHVRVQHLTVGYHLLRIGSEWPAMNQIGSTDGCGLFDVMLYDGDNYHIFVQHDEYLPIRIPLVPWQDDSLPEPIIVPLTRDDGTSNPSDDS